MTYTLHCGDCLDYMTTMADNSVDLIVTSPPYHVGKKYEADASLASYAYLLNALTTEASRVVKPSGYFAINTNDRLTSTDQRFGINPVLPIIDQMCYRATNAI